MLNKEFWVLSPECYQRTGRAESNASEKHKLPWNVEMKHCSTHNYNQGECSVKVVYQKSQVIGAYSKLFDESPIEISHRIYQIWISEI